MREIVRRRGRLTWFFAFTLAAVAGVTSAAVVAATSPQQEIQKLLPNDGSSAFGVAIAASGNTAVIGASGVVHVYARDASDAWSLQATLAPSGGATRDAFGRSVAIDGGTLVVGASGAAYTFTRGAGGDWIEHQQLAVGDPAGLPSSVSVAISGDTVVIGAERDDDARGAAYVYVRGSAGGWARQARLVAGDGAAGDRFGRAVAVSGDTVLIGAPFDGDHGVQSGSAYVFTRDGSGAWFERAELVASNAASAHLFGSAVALHGATALVGAPGDEPGGSAYLYRRTAVGTWSEQRRLLASDRETGDEFGAAVALRGDIAVVGARNDDVDDLEIGSAYVYRRAAGGAWVGQAKLVVSDFTSSALVGHAVAVAGESVLSGAPASGASGAAYVYRPDLGPVSAALRCPGDVDGDGAADLVLVTPTGQVRVTDVAGAPVNGFDLSGPAGVVDAESIADTNGNGAPEIVLLRSGDVGAEVRDLLTGAVLASVRFRDVSDPFGLEIVPDRNGNGVPELARLGRNPTAVELRDALTGQPSARVGFSSYLVPRDLVVHPDLDADGRPELALLGDNRSRQGADKIEFRTAAGGALVQEIWLGKGWRVHEQALLADQNGNGSAEMAVLRVHPSWRVNVQIRDTATRELLRFVGFQQRHLPGRLLVLADMNGNGSDEVAVFTRRLDGDDQRVIVKDGLTGEELNRTWFDRNFPARDFVACGDVNGNGAEDVAFLGQRPSDRRYKVVVKDGLTGERLAMIYLRVNEA